MTDPTSDAPTIDLPLSEAVQGLTGFEALGIQKHYGTTFDQLGGIALTIGVVWAYENRGDKKRSWASVEAMTFRELTAGYFAPEPDDVNEDEPDSDAGKDG